MAKNSLQKHTKKIDELIQQSEQLRILKNFIKNKNVLTKGEILTLIEAMEGKTNE